MEVKYLDLSTTLVWMLTLIACHHTMCWKSHSIFTFMTIGRATNQPNTIFQTFSWSNTTATLDSLLLSPAMLNTNNLSLNGSHKAKTPPLEMPSNWIYLAGVHGKNAQMERLCTNSSDSFLMPTVLSNSLLAMHSNHSNQNVKNPGR